MFTKEKDMSKVFGPRNWLKNVGKKNPTFFLSLIGSTGVTWLKEIC